MKSKRNDDPNYAIVWTMYHGRCVLCGQPAVTIHEIKPRSHNILHWKDVDNRVTICNLCHEKVHKTGWSKWVDVLCESSSKLLDKLNSSVIQ